MPKVSIVMPLFNKGPYVFEALNSILSQKYVDYELIIINDQSTDNTMEIVDKFKDSRIKVFSNSRNMGQANSLNNGIEKAIGEYITFAHGDDVWLDDFLSTHVNLMDQHRNINISHALAHSIDNSGKIKYVNHCDDNVQYTITDHMDVIKRLVKGSYITSPTVLLRNGFFPFFSNRFVFCIDWDLWLRLAGENNKFLFINKPLIFYRYSSDNVTSLAMRTGINIIEDYLVLNNFFSNYPEYVKYKRKSLIRMSMRTLRLSREVTDKDIILLYHKLAILCSTVNLINPLYYTYLLTGLVFGHKGMKVLKSVSKLFSRLKSQVSGFIRIFRKA